MKTDCRPSPSPVPRADLRGPPRRLVPLIFVAMLFAVAGARPGSVQAKSYIAAHRWADVGTAADEYRILPPGGWEIIVRTSHPPEAGEVEALNLRLREDGPPQHMLDLCPGQRWSDVDAAQPLLCRPESPVAAQWLLRPRDKVLVVVRHRAERVFAGGRYVALLERGESLRIGDLKELRWVRRLNPAELRPRIAGPVKDARGLYQAEFVLDRSRDVLTVKVPRVFGVRRPRGAPLGENPSTEWGVRLEDGTIVDVVTDPPGADAPDPARRAELIQLVLAANSDSFGQPLEELVTEALLRPGRDVVPALLHAEQSVASKRSLPRRFVDALLWCAGGEHAALVGRLWGETRPPGSFETIQEALSAADALGILGTIVLSQDPETPRVTEALETMASLGTPEAAALISGVVRGWLRDKPEDYVQSRRNTGPGWDSSGRQLAALASMGPEAAPQVRALVAERLPGWRRTLRWFALHGGPQDAELLAGLADEVTEGAFTFPFAGPAAAGLWRAQGGPTPKIEALLSGTGAYAAADWLDAAGAEASAWVLPWLASHGKLGDAGTYLCREPRRAAVEPLISALRRAEPGLAKETVRTFECLIRGAGGLPTNRAPTDPSWDAILARHKSAAG